MPQQALKNLTVSNKTSYDIKTINKPTINPIITSPSIDKMSVVIPDIYDEEYITATQHVLWDACHSSELGFTYTKQSQGYKTCVKMHHLPKKKTTQTGSPLLFQINNGIKKRPQIRMEWNPSKMPYEFAEQIDDMLMCSCGFGFYELLSKAKVTRIDINVDIHNVEFDAVMIKIKKNRIANTFFDQKGRIQTMNFGSSKGNQYSIYSKSGQTGLAYFGHVLRIEARMRPKTLYMKDLKHMSNPLTNIEIFDMQHNDTSIDKDFWKMFRDSCRYRGVSNALKILSQNKRNKMKKAVNNSHAKWWIPELFWDDQWISALENHDFLDFPPCPEITLNKAAGA